jgi:two-component system, sensor histidine kinase PdtaS
MGLRIGADVSAETLTGNSPLMHPPEKGVGALPPQAVTHSLALAVIAFSHAPLLILDGDLTVIAANIAFCDAFEIDPATVRGCQFAQLGAGEWNIPHLSLLLRVAASGFAKVKSYEMELHSAGQVIRFLNLDAQKIDDADQGGVRLLVTVSDITAARSAERLKDDLLREKEAMLQELQHRVANSLQIIASVLLQSARKVQSDETRRHLHDAHHRVMSVAALQRQLTASTPSSVELGPYFAALCESIGASMIHDHDQLSLQVNVDYDITSADVSMSLGLIVTELVINSLKHAFPGDRAGRITVGYRAHASDWVLSVSDDGIGMFSAPENTAPGLGTSIVRALAKQLHARVEITRANPGTTVSIVHIPEASLADAPIRQAQTLAV